MDLPSELQNTPKPEIYIMTSDNHVIHCNKGPALTIAVCYYFYPYFVNANAFTISVLLMIPMRFP